MNTVASTIVSFQIYNIMHIFNSLFYTLLWADNFKMAASRELRCMLLAITCVLQDNRCMKIYEINCTVLGMIVGIKCVIKMVVLCNKYVSDL